ncbi:hypothetical protein QBC34DRAFT_417532 [Podospora aff. communis PSN243]|uniref:Uncharacterized protein n=1 Tax=Podospora aff. communis PSN243 TaxID=3040156 RepID=A0AAV9G3L5_9PEZI|nr:hypothetical protein QBC34DRAFT_417532 [Podospora aff. communis PSN243]
MSASSPLLNNSGANTNPAKSSSAPSPLAKTLLNIVGITRAAFGVGCLIAPSFALQIVGLSSSLSAEASIITRMFGVREIIVGEALLLADRSAKAKRGTAAQEAGHEEVKRAIWLNIATDSLDVVALAFALAQGVLDKVTIGKMTVTALLYAGMGLETAWLYK